LGRLAFVAMAAIALAAPATAGIFPRDTPPGHCRTVQGRMAIYNGTFSFRIWVAGTHRMLRVVDEAGANFGEVEKLPAPLAQALAPVKDDLWNRWIFADYRVCDFTRSRPGVMQSVTLADARRIRIIVAAAP
jgi:hypothetical protein